MDIAIKFKSVSPVVLVKKRHYVSYRAYFHGGGCRGPRGSLRGILVPLFRTYYPLIGTSGNDLRQDEILQSNPYKSSLRQPQPAITNFFPDCTGNNDAKQDIEGLISETSSPNYHATRTPFSHKLKSSEDQSPLSTTNSLPMSAQHPNTKLRRYG